MPWGYQVPDSWIQNYLRSSQRIKNSYKQKRTFFLQKVSQQDVLHLSEGRDPPYKAPLLEQVENFTVSRNKF